MTCIVAVKDPEKRTIIMGGDSRSTVNGTLSVMLAEEDAKIVEVTPGFLFGHAGAGKIRNLVSQLKIRFKGGSPRPNFNLETELLESIIPEFKRLAKKWDFLASKDGLVSLDGSLLVAIGDQLCTVYTDFTVTPVSTDYWAIGSGQKLAVGSLATSQGILNPREQVIKALEVAAMFENTVGGPFILKSTIAIPTRT